MFLFLLLFFYRIVRRVLRVHRLSVFSFDDDLHTGGGFLQIADRVGGETFVYPEEIFAGDRFVFASDKQDGFFFAGFLDTGADEGVVLPAVGGFQDQSGQSLQFPRTFAARNFRSVPSFVVSPPESAGRSVAGVGEESCCVGMQFPDRNLCFFFRTEVTGGDRFELCQFAFGIVFEYLVVHRLHPG